MYFSIGPDVCVFFAACVILGNMCCNNSRLNEPPFLTAHNDTPKNVIKYILINKTHMC